jgi:hypothetical protein
VQQFLNSCGSKAESVSPQDARTSDGAQSPIALRRELLASLTIQSIKDRSANVLA